MLHPILRDLARNQVILELSFITLGWLLLQIREVLIALFIAFIIQATLLPAVDFMIKKGIPKPLAVALVFVGSISIITLILVSLIPFFIAQINLLFNKFPLFIDRAASSFGFDFEVSQINKIVTSELGNIGRNAYSLTSKIFGGIFSLLTTFVISFYLIADHERIQGSVAALFPERSQKKTLETIKQIEEKLGAWLRGQLVLSFFIGGITYIALSLIGLEFALPLAVLAGLLEIIPTIGPIIAAIPAILVALNSSGGLAIVVVAAYIVIQILENNFLVPRIMQKAVGLNPVIVITGIVIGGKLLGVLGALLSIPFITLLIVIFNTLRSTKG